MIFKPTVLKTYWEFEARTGTVVKLAVSTFTWRVLFLWPSLSFWRKNRKRTKLWIMRHDPLFTEFLDGSHLRDERTSNVPDGSRGPYGTGTVRWASQGGPETLHPRSRTAISAKSVMIHFFRTVRTGKSSKIQMSVGIFLTKFKQSWEATLSNFEHHRSSNTDSGLHGLLPLTFVWKRPRSRNRY